MDYEVWTHKDLVLGIVLLGLVTLIIHLIILVFG